MFKYCPHNEITTLKCSKSSYGTDTNGQPHVWMNTFFDITFCVIEDCIILDGLDEVYIKLSKPMNEYDIKYNKSSVKNKA